MARAAPEPDRSRVVIAYCSRLESPAGFLTQGGAVYTWRPAWCGPVRKWRRLRNWTFTSLRKTRRCIMVPAEQTVFIVEDDAAVRDSLGLLLGLHGLRTQSFGCAEDFLR